MKNDFNEPAYIRTELGEALRRGNGGSFESDMAAIKKAADVVLLYRPNETLGEMLTRFAVWVLYAFHDANRGRVIDDSNSDVPPGHLRFSVRDDGKVLMSGWPGSLPQLISDTMNVSVFGFPLTIEAHQPELAKVNITNDVFAADDKRPASIDEIPTEIRERMKADRAAAERESKTVRCVYCERDLSTGGGLAGNKYGVFCSSICLEDFERDRQREAKKLDSELNAQVDKQMRKRFPGLAEPRPADDLIREDPPRVSYYDGDAMPASARQCDQCKRHFTGPAKIDARNTFCGEVCQLRFADRAETDRLNREGPAVVARPGKLTVKKYDEQGNAEYNRPTIADRIETDHINQDRQAAALCDSDGPRCPICNRPDCGWKK